MGVNYDQSCSYHWYVTVHRMVHQIVRHWPHVPMSMSNQSCNYHQWYVNLIVSHPSEGHQIVFRWVLTRASHESSSLEETVRASGS